MRNYACKPQIERGEECRLGGEFQRYGQQIDRLSGRSRENLYRVFFGAQHGLTRHAHKVNVMKVVVVGQSHGFLQVNATLAEHLKERFGVGNSRQCHDRLGLKFTEANLAPCGGNGVIREAPA